MKQILIILAHPKFEHSVVNRALIDAVKNLEGVRIQDLYELYPDFNIDVQREQELLFGSEVLVWHHPLYWYSAPPLLKQWIDLVLEFGWAYGPRGIYLSNKLVLSAVTSGGPQESYSAHGKHGHTFGDFLLPFAQTAKLCRMQYLPFFHVGGTHKINAKELDEAASQYRNLLIALRDSTSVATHPTPSSNSQP
ncbi:glutathione-regulated potassium-efflux system oxidoreductase KefF [Pararhodonellum marinum]|uniref:glutathione-regulated potassium-efflux system oxidoreductase KefF n=1 Tax=Pararhodonellum marinum TaxID=2755358 RepID=UPI00188E87B4|nr:NAD(P)H-dependent oxidoreductase [Pararhodonellum marinum]